MKEFLSHVEGLSLSLSLPISSHLPPFYFPYFSSASFQGNSQNMFKYFSVANVRKTLGKSGLKKERLFPDFWGRIESFKQKQGRD